MCCAGLSSCLGVVEGMENVVVAKLDFCNEYDVVDMSSASSMYGLATIVAGGLGNPADLRYTLMF